MESQPHNPEFSFQVCYYYRDCAIMNQPFWLCSKMFFFFIFFFLYCVFLFLLQSFLCLSDVDQHFPCVIWRPLIYHLISANISPYI